MLGLGNTLSGGIVPAAAAASFSDTKAITGLVSTSTFLQSTTNLPSVFHHASNHVRWTVVHTWDHDKDETHRAWALGFPGSPYISMNYYGQNTQTLFWFFTNGNDTNEHMPIYVNAGMASGKKTMIITKTGDTLEDYKIYVNGGVAFDSGTNPENATPKFTAAPDNIWFGKTPHGGGFVETDLEKKFNDFAIFDGAFDATEATEAYNSGETLDMRTHSRASDLKHYWMMGDGDDAGDGTGNADGTGDVIFDMAGDCDLTMTGIDATDIVSW